MTPYALFDFDGTLRKGDSIIDFCLYAYQNKLCSLSQLLKGGAMGIAFLCHKVTAEESKKATLSFLAGHSQEEIQTHAKRFCETVIVPRLFPKGQEVIKEHKSKGHQVLIITASPAFYLAPLTDMLPIDGLIGTRVDVDENDVYIGDNCRGIQKPLRLADYLACKGDQLDAKHSTGYGDTTGDIAMMELCHHIVAVNPKAKLKKQLKNATTVHWGK